MVKTRRRLYLFLVASCIVGFLWLFYNYTYATNHNDQTIQVCLFKNITGIPCPSCGSTRAVEVLLHGHLQQSILINPLGLIIACIMFLSPLWVMYDVLLKKNTLFDFYIYFEKVLKRPLVYMPLVVLVVINWVWNITKGL